MKPAIPTALFSLIAIAALIWNQPAMLLDVALFIEHRSARMVRWMRIRAQAKRDANETYRRAHLFYSGLSE